MGAAYEYPAYSYPYGYGPETTSVCNTMRRVSSRIEPTRQTWKKVIYGPKKKFVIPKRFETSSIRITLKIKNKTYRWGNSCESSENYKGVYVYLRGCEQTLSGKIIGRARVEITYSGIPYTDY